jgi:DNA-binding XRE family transcriptional regulator/ribosomal protein S13
LANDAVKLARRSLGARLAELRRRSHYTTQAQLAKPLGYSRSTVANAEAGIGAAPEFWDKVDAFLEAKGDLIAGFREIRMLQADQEQGGMDSQAGRRRRDPKDTVIIDASLPEDDPEQLLLRLYIPSERLYAEEAARLLSLFREWLHKARGQGVELHEYHTAAGTMYEFFAGGPASGIDLRAQMDVFTNFLGACTENQSAAVEMLTIAGISPASSAEIVQKFGLEARRVQRDLKYEWQERILRIQHRLEEELDYSGVDLRTLPSRQLTSVIETYVPGPAAEQSLALLASLEKSRPNEPITVQFNQQIVGQLAGTILQNVQGTMKFGFEGEALLRLVKEQASQDEAPLLEAAIYELHKPEVRGAVRSKAKQRLLTFLKGVGGVGRDVSKELLVKWLESKGV